MAAVRVRVETTFGSCCAPRLASLLCLFTGPVRQEVPRTIRLLSRVSIAFNFDRRIPSRRSALPSRLPRDVAPRKEDVVFPSSRNFDP